MIVGAVLLVTGPFFGLLGTVVGTWGAFADIESSQGQLRPERLASRIEFSLATTVAGLLAGFLGGTLLVVSLFASARSHDRILQVGMRLVGIIVAFLALISLVPNIFYGDPQDPQAWQVSAATGTRRA